jgi:hypothetical protein
MANQAHSETTESDLEEMIERAGKKKGKDCGFKEAQDVQENPEFYLPLGLSDPDEGLGDGECGQFQAWDEDKGRMVKVNERSLPNICERVCEDDEIPEDPYAKFAFGQEKKWKKDRLKERHINRKSESIDATIQLTEKIKNSGYQIAAASAMADSYKRNNELVMAVLLDTGDPLPPGDPLTACLQRDKTAEIAAWIAKIVLEVANTVAQVAAKVAEGAFEIQDKACRQSVAGFNTSVGCIPALIVKLVLEGASDVIEALIAGCDLTIEHGNYFGLDNNFECVAEIRNAQIQMYNWVWAIKQQGEDLGGDIGELDGAIETLKRYVLENREYIRNTREIVLTPHGRRDEVQLYEPSPPTSPP